MSVDGGGDDGMDLREFGSLSPFELKTKLLELAEDNPTTMALNAGRGNPNWVATTPREAFFLLGAFGIAESKRVWDEPGIGGLPDWVGMAERFQAFLDGHRGEPGAELLQGALDYGVERGFVPDDWVYELADGIIGDNYPEPDRMLPCIEQIVHDYLIHELCNDDPPEGSFDLFAVEGGTAAMCYIFDTLVANFLLKPGDKIALGVPVFTPYIEIPELARYNFEIVKINASEIDETLEHAWQYPDEELEKLADPTVKAFFIVNPSNPGSVMIRAEALDKITEIIRASNPELLLISDDVYGTFVDGFRSLMAVAPQNTIAVYSYSKYYGCTGWRLGVVAIHKDNVFDKMLAAMPDDAKAALAKRYGTISLDPDSLPLIDRMVADSRQVALNHTAGLSLPQQVQMALFSLHSLLDPEANYRTRLKAILRDRLQALSDGLGVDMGDDEHRAHYYVDIDGMLWGAEMFGTDVTDFIQDRYEPLDVVFRLAKDESVVVLSGVGFDGPEWSIRVSLANLDEAAYSHIGNAIRRVTIGYISEWYESQAEADPEPET